MTPKPETRKMWALYDEKGLLQLHGTRRFARINQVSERDYAGNPCRVVRVEVVVKPV